MANRFKVSVTLPVSPKQLYAAWLDSRQHSDFTGKPASIVPFVSGAFEAFDGYITGKTLELDPGKRILQSWRTKEFPADAPDSLLEVLITKSEKGSRLTLLHTNLPKDQVEQYKDGWNEYYFVPMKEFFSAKKSEERILIIPERLPGRKTRS
jgi:activator of HSP90 ATPase